MYYTKYSTCWPLYNWTLCAAIEFPSRGVMLLISILQKGGDDPKALSTYRDFSYFDLEKGTLASTKKWGDDLNNLQHGTGVMFSLVLYVVDCEPMLIHVTWKWLHAGFLLSMSTFLFCLPCSGDRSSGVHGPFPLRLLLCTCFNTY